MKVLTYNTTNLSTRDRVTISNLLSLFEGRLNAKWVAADHLPGKPADLVLLDVDEPQGRSTWDQAGSAESRLAVTENDRWPGAPFVSRPIRAFGPNGIVVQLNSVVQSIDQSIDSAAPRETATKFRMTGRLETIAPPRSVHPPAPVSAKPVSAAQPPPAAAPPKPVAEEPVRTRVAVRWGPPEPIVLKPLAHIPGAKIHWLGPEWAQKQPVPEIVTPAPPRVEVQPEAPSPATPAKSWTAPPAPEVLPALVKMPVSHHPVEVHGPVTPVIGRARIEPRPVVEAVENFLRPAPREWKQPVPEIVPELIDFQSLQPADALPTPEPVVETFGVETVKEPLWPDTPSLETELIAYQAEPAVVESVVEETVVEQAFVEQTSQPGIEEPAEEALPLEVQEELALLSHAISESAYQEEAADESAADWWGAVDLEEPAGTPAEETGESPLFAALKSIKASGQPAIVEIAGLPSVCVVPARNVYFTTAPAARFETSIDGRAEVTWRTCATESEARELSGTEQSRQASLELLCWTASLLLPPADTSRIADQAVRLRRWPPVTESRGRSKYLRYATLLSGAEATPRELAEITGDTLEEVVCFVNACSKMNLLETPEHANSPRMTPAAETGGAGILRGMIEQLAPAKL